jgi:hypothetical protein
VAGQKLVLIQLCTLSNSVESKNRISQKEYNVIVLMPSFKRDGISIKSVLDS